MPISAPPPSWASIKNKPNTVSGFGITDMASQSVANATNVTNVTVAQVLAANAAATRGAVGTFATVSYNSGNPATFNSTYSGSSLTQFNDNNGVWEGAGLSGTWRSMGATDGHRYTTSSNALGAHLFLRIS
jgi:hypothetical protein